MDFIRAAGKTAKRYIRKGAIKARKAARKAGKTISEYTPEPVKEFAGAVKEMASDATEGVRKSYDFAKKQVKEENLAKGAIKELDKQVDSSQMAKTTHKAYRNGKPSRYQEDVSYSRINKDTGEYVPEKTIRRINKKQIAKDVGAGAAAAGAIAGGAALMSGDDNEELIDQIRRKRKNGEPLTASEKRLLRLMEK